MNKWIYICSLILATTFFYSCEEDEQLMYQEDSRVYFFKHNTSSTRDSIIYSFAFESADVSTDTIALRFRILGFPKDYDREIPVQLTEGSTAKLGYHFKINKLFIPANSSDATADLIFFRRAGLKDSIVNAELQIVENQHFKPGYEDLDLSSKLNRITYRFSLTDKLNKPSNWETYWKNMFGEYSNTKILFLTELLNYTDWNAAWLFPQDQSNMINKARVGIYEYEKVNGSLIDENENRVIIP